MTQAKFKWLISGRGRPFITKQTISYSSPAGQDDGGYRAGLVVAPRFSLYQANVLFDNATGLMWPKRCTQIWPGNALGEATGVGRGTWDSGTAYVRGDVVKAADNKYYVAEQASTNVDPNAGGNPTYWTETTWFNDTAVSTSYHQYQQQTAWQAAIDKAEALAYGGFTDWRLPSITELLTLATWSGGNGGLFQDANATHGDGGPGFLGANYQNGMWSGTTNPKVTTLAYRLWCYNGTSQAGDGGASIDCQGKTATYATLPVRGPVL